jgi:hypothetical protein
MEQPERQASSELTNETSLHTAPNDLLLQFEKLLSPLACSDPTATWTSPEAQKLET